MLGLGTEFLGGETNIELNFSSKTLFEKRQQQYHWRWANNDTKLVKQITLGKISSHSVASIYSPLIGTVVTNAPTTFRRSFGSYTMADFTEPGWTVELYINNVIVDFTTADASGFYKFDIPLVYGASNVLVKFYGPWGEERQKEQVINVPFNFLPVGEVQYTATAALVQDTSHSVYARGETNFGISRHLTLGGGYEFLSSVSSTPSIPFVNGSAQLFGKFLLNGEYAYGVRTKALLSYSLPSNFVIDVDYTKYASEQKAITFNYLEERKVRVSVPVSIKSFKAYSRLIYSQNILKETTYSTAEATVSTFYKGVSANFSANANWLGNYDTYIYGNMALGFRFFKTFSFRPQAQYDFTKNTLITTKVELESNFSPKCNLSLVWENNIRSRFNTVELTFRYDFSFAQVSLNTRASDKYVMTGQSARGSFAFGSGHNYLIADRRSQVGKAGLTVVPFLDINDNNRRDEDEPITTGMNIRINGGRILPDSRDSIVRILDLEPFASYMLEFSDTQFDNIAWQIPHKAISILMDPNQFKLLEVPIKVMGEINGMVYMKTGSKMKAQGRIQINIFTSKGKFVAKTQSESDGYYNYIGLGPGKYYAQIDSTQSSRLKATPMPSRYDFQIMPTENGDIIDNIEFQLIKEIREIQGLLAPDTKSQSSEPVAPKSTSAQLAQPKDKTPKTEKPVPSSAVTKALKQKAPKQDAVTVLNTPQPTPTAKAERQQTLKETVKAQSAATEFREPVLSDTNPDKATSAAQYFIQGGAFKKEAKAKNFAAELFNTTSKEWFVVHEKEFYKVRLGYFPSAKAAQAILQILNTPAKTYYLGKLE
jgi:hypothetical protein